MMDFDEMEINIFLGKRYNIFHPLHIPSAIVTFVQLLQLIDDGAFHQAFACILMMRGHGGRVVTLSPPTSEVGGSIPMTALSGKAGSCLPLVGSLQYTTLANSMYWFPLPFQLPVVI